MALLKRTDLVKLLGISHATISMAVKRGHLIEKNGKIDDRNQINALFISKNIRDDLEEEAEREATEQSGRDTNDLAYLSALKTKIWIKKTNEEYEIAKVKKEKLQGSVIPVELVQSIIVLVAESVKIAYMDANEEIFLKISAKHRLTRAEHGSLKSLQADVINKAVDAAAEEAKKSLRRLQSEFSDTRGKGERK